MYYINLHYTILLYLNDSFQGGRTIIVDSFDKNDINEIIKPKSGLCLLIKQNILHYAEEVTSGLKYILRGDIFINETPTLYNKETTLS